jgi:hypothetical protein
MFQKKNDKTSEKNNLNNKKTTSKQIVNIDAEMFSEVHLEPITRVKNCEQESSGLRVQ